MIANMASYNAYLYDDVVNMGVAMTDVQFSSQKLKTIFATRILVEK